MVVVRLVFVSHIDVSSRAVVVMVERADVVVSHLVGSFWFWASWLFGSDLAVSSNPAALGIEVSHRPA
jgi:hypothetical protein